MPSRLMKVTTKQVVDNETGELIQENSQSKVIGIEREPKHIKLYMNDIGLIYGLEPSLMKTMIELLKKAYTSDNILSLLPTIRRKLESVLEIKPRTLQNRLTMLVKKGMLLEIDERNKNEYFVNAKVFGKGEWRNIRKARSRIKTTLKYENGKRTTKHEFDTSKVST